MVVQDSIETWLTTFELDLFLRDHALAVMLGLPPDVRRDLMEDPCFSLSDYEPALGAVMHVRMKSPGRNGSRSVVLKRTLRRRPEPFVRYVIAHELAHAHLRNAGRFPGDDPEEAADALAAQWGFPKPPRAL